MRTGSCQCGRVAYAVTGITGPLYCCHCTECRKQSASAFGMSLAARREDLRLQRGTPRMWSRKAASGRTLYCMFCGDCGSRLWHENDAGSLSIKAGSLDDPVDASRAIHIWTRSRLPGIAIPPQARQYEQEPP